MINDTSKTGDMATIHDVLQQPERKEEIQYFIDALSDYGLDVLGDADTFIEGFERGSIQDNKMALCLLSGELKGFSEMLTGIDSIFPDTPWTKEEVMEAEEFGNETPRIAVEIEGTHEVADGMVAVTASNGKTKAQTTQVGESPAEAIAKMMLHEIVSGR